MEYQHHRRSGTQGGILHEADTRDRGWNTNAPTFTPGASGGGGLEGNFVGRVDSGLSVNGNARGGSSIMVGGGRSVRVGSSGAPGLSKSSLSSNGMGSMCSFSANLGSDGGSGMCVLCPQIGHAPPSSASFSHVF